jgi:hypothetical protein
VWMVPPQTREANCPGCLHFLRHGCHPRPACLPTRH